MIPLTRLCALVMTVAGCANGITEPPAADRAEGWRADLELVRAEVLRSHPPPATDPGFASFNAAMDELSASIPELADEQVGVALQRLLVGLGDGHTTIVPDDAGLLALQALMVDFYWFDDGVYVVGVRPGLGTLYGARVIAVGGMPIAEFQSKLGAFVPRDNEMSARWLGAQLMQYTALIRATGASAPDAGTALDVVLASGGTMRVNVASHDRAALPRLNPPGGESAETPRYLRALDQAYWLDSLPSDRTLYVNFNAVRDDPGETLSGFAARLGALLESGSYTSVVLDVRLNNGGNNQLLAPLQEVLQRFNDAAAAHRLVVIAGRATFSAGQNFVNWVERFTRATFVGEPTGSRPNFMGDVSATILPYSGLVVSIASRVYQDSDPGDARPWIAPDVAVPVRSEDYFLNRDPAFDAAMRVIRESAGQEGRATTTR